MLEAQRRTIASIEFVIAKTRLLDRLRGRINARQEKALLRVMRDGPDGFEGGLSAGKYRAITGATAKLSRSKSWLINQALREYLERQEQAQSRWLETLRAMESVAQGRVVSGESVHEWLRSWGTEDELPPPGAGQ